MKAIGIYPGTFDPVHEGHVAFAQATLSTCGLDNVYFIPERSPRGKTNVSELSARTDLIRASLANSPSLDVINLKSDRFTVRDTLPEIETLFGPARFTLLLGSDVAGTLDGWPQVSELLADWSFAIGMRHADSVDDIDAMFERLERTNGVAVRRKYIRTDKADMSSSLRRRGLSS